MSSQERHKEAFWNDFKVKQETGTMQDFFTQDNNPKKESPYNKIAREIAGLVGEKQIAYGDSFGNSGEVLKVLYPNGITPDQFGDALTLIRIIDKLFRIANKKDAFGESPYRDIIGYGLLAVARDENGT